MSDIEITIQTISEIDAHPDADRLEIVKILGTQCIVTKGEHQAKDQVMYFPPNMMIPESVADILGVKKYLKHTTWKGKKVQSRIAACRIRGITSYGFIASLNNGWAAALNVAHYLGKLEDDLVLTDVFHGEKYEPPALGINGLSGMKGRNEYALHEGSFHRYTNIQNFYRYTDVFEDDEQVVVTEKIHGCLISQTRIRMANGTSKYIRDIQPGEFVAGTLEGAIVPSKVLQVFQNGISGDWLKIKFKRKRCGRGNSFGSITCTPNHQFLIGDSYQDASTLKIGDQLSVLRSDWHLSPIQEQILLGKMLGDGSLFQTSTSASIGWGHVSKDLTEWTARGLGDLCSDNRGSRISGYGSRICTAITHSSVFILDKFESFIKDGHKIVPDWVADNLTPLAIAFWYMDDGSLGQHESQEDSQEDRALFAVCGFTETDCQVLIKALKKFCITASYYISDGYSRLRLNANEAEKLFLLIAPYIPKSLQYKLPERYRGHVGWLPQTKNSFKSDLTPQVITSITSLDTPRQRWDLETETHNYLSSNIVTHNSNSRVGLVRENGVWVPAAGSHKVRWMYCKEAARYWTPLTQRGMREMLDDISQRESSDVIVFGEIFGSGVQDMDYGAHGDDGYRVFDISVNGEYLNWPDVVAFCHKHGLRTVPVIYEGPWVCIKEVLDDYACGLTSVGAPERKFKGREGIVIKPVKERLTGKIGGERSARRAILKYISADYLDRKGAQDNG